MSEKTNLLKSAWLDDVDTCRRLIEAGADVTTLTDGFGATALHYAALNPVHGKELVDLFVSKGLCVEKTDRRGLLPLHHALRMKNLEAAKELLQHRRDKRKHSNLLHFSVAENNLESAQIVHRHDASLICEIGHFGESVVHIGAAFADERMCRWLLEEVRVDVHALSQENGASVLHCAAQNKRHGADLVKFFAVCGLDVNARDKGDLTPLHHALKVENLQAAQQLLDLGADLKGHENLLHFCIISGKLLSAKFVHGKDGEQVKRKSGGKNALHLAAEFGPPEMSEWLIKNLGVSVLSLEENRKNTVLHYAAMNKSHGCVLVRYFNQCGIYVNAFNAHQMTSLHFALGSGNVDAAQVLIELGASWTVQQLGRNLAHFCAQQNQLHSLIFLHLQNCDLFTQKGPHGETALHVAAQFADPDVCQWLITKKGADVSASCGGRSVLHLAALNKLHGKQLVRHFASFKLNIDGKSSSGKTPLHFALECGNIAAAAELLELGADFRVKFGGGFNLLHFCVAEKRLDSAKFVHEKDERMIHELGRGRESSLHIAAEGGDLEVCRWVVQQGVDDVHARNEEGKSAIDYAASRELKQFLTACEAGSTQI